MPYTWEQTLIEAPALPGASAYAPRPVEGEAVLTLWPHQSLSHSGFVAFIGISAALVLVPLLAVLGSPMLWILLAFLAAALAGMWFAIERNRHHRSGGEELRATREQVRLTHREPSGRVLSWEANPYWVEVKLRPEGGKVENYLTLRGAGREVEIGAFLAPEERVALRGELDDLFARLRRVAPG